MIEAGNGGAGNAGGAGGSVSNVNVAGDIGDYTSAFTFGLSSGMGGISAGVRGAGLGSASNGSVSGITADRIASIVAGGGFLNADAVYSLSGIHANSIGADLNNDGIFTFTPSPAPVHTGFIAADGDVPIDGLVVVRAAGLAGTMPPILKLITV
jgi:hypothetical protein